MAGVVRIGVLKYKNGVQKRKNYLPRLTVAVLAGSGRIKFSSFPGR